MHYLPLYPSISFHAATTTTYYLFYFRTPDMYSHSGRFYGILSTELLLPVVTNGQQMAVADEMTSHGSATASTTILSLLARYCAHEDPSTRKFASFASECITYLQFTASATIHCATYCAILSSFYAMLCCPRSNSSGNAMQCNNGTITTTTQSATQRFTPRSCTLCCRVPSTRCWYHSETQLMIRPELTLQVRSVTSSAMVAS